MSSHYIRSLGKELGGCRLGGIVFRLIFGNRGSMIKVNGDCCFHYRLRSPFHELMSWRAFSRNLRKLLEPLFLLPLPLFELNGVKGLAKTSTLSSGIKNDFCTSSLSLPNCASSLAKHVRKLPKNFLVSSKARFCRCQKQLWNRFRFRAVLDFCC